MKFFPIVPIKYLNKLAGLSGNQMILAQWLTEKRYFNFYKKRREKGDFIILDNGACELGDSMPLEELIHWYEKLGGCDILVIPDTKEGDNEELFRNSLDAIITQYEGDRLDPKVGLMAVPQSIGNLDVMTGFSRVGYIGLSRTIAWDLGFGGREGIIEKYKDCGKKFHLLGIRKNPIDEILAVKAFGDLVLGVDSSFPYRLFSRGHRIEEYRPYPEHDSMYQKDLSDEVLNFCIEEFKAFLEWINE